MENIYLEKIAGWKKKFEQTSAGKAMGSTQGITNASLLAGLGQSKPTGSFNTGSKKVVSQGGFFGYGAKKSLTNAGTMKATGDVLANKAPVADRLAAMKAKAPAAPKGILSRAVGLAKKHPFAAGAVAAGTALAGASAISGRKKEQPAMAYYQ